MASSGKLTADMLADLEAPHEVKISPSGAQIVYNLRSDWNRPRLENHWVSSLWIADVGKKHSARQLTSGNSYDSWPQWHPDEKSIAFLSDSAKDQVAAIYSLGLDSGAKPVALTSTENEQSIAKFAWSEDGKYIAYVSADEKTEERKAKEKRKDDVKVFGEHWDHARLRIIEVATKNTTTLYSQSRNVVEFTWSPDSKSIAFVTQERPEYEIQAESGSKIEIIQLADQTVTDLITVDGLVNDLCWVQNDLWWRSNYLMDKFKSSNVVYTMPISTKAVRRYGYGEDSCASPWGFPPALVKISSGKLAVQVLSGLSDQLHILPAGDRIFDIMQEVRSWHVSLANDTTTIVVVTSTASSPFEAYSIISGHQTCLTNHGEAFTSLPLATAEPFYTRAQDGTPLDAVLVYPKHPAPKPWPTIVLVHGGPYGRVSRGFDLPYFNWSTWFTSHGYAVFLPNYRGGSSHGEDFVAGVRGTAGMRDYSDTIDLVTAAVEAGIIDKSRVGIGGWSYGGYLSFLAVARHATFPFQAAVCGAGLSDWDHTIMTSTGWRSAIEIAGSAPWIGGVDDVHNRRGSALWEMKDTTTKTPVLILQGEDDDIVPVAQALGFHHACMHYGVPCEMAIYPREGHGAFPPFERLHYIDLLERMKRFYDQHLGMNGAADAA